MYLPVENHGLNPAETGQAMHSPIAMGSRG